MPDPKPTWVSDIDIQEVGGLRSIVLSGRALPHRTLDFGGENVIDRDQNQGNPLKTIQILAPDVDPTTIGGRWKAEYMDGSRGEIEIGTGDGESILASEKVADDPNTALLDVCEAIEDIRAACPLVDVTWMNRTLRGILLGFRYKISDGMDLTWDMTFEWESYRHRHGFKASLKTFYTPPDRIAADWADRLNSFVFFLNGAFGFDPVAGTLDAYQVPVLSDAFKAMKKVQDFLKRINVALGAVKALNNTIARAVTTPSQLAREVLQSLLDVKQVFVDMADLWRTTAFSEYGAWNTTIDALVASKSPSFYELPSKRLLMKQQILDMQYAVEVDIKSIKSSTEVEGQIRDIVVAKEGEHLGQITRKYFGSFSLWPKLAKYNKLDNPVLSGGKLVTIPHRFV